MRTKRFNRIEDQPDMKTWYQILPSVAERYNKYLLMGNITVCTQVLEKQSSTQVQISLRDFIILYKYILEAYVY